VDEEFTANGGDDDLHSVDPKAADRVDLLTVVCHELGHLAGLEDVTLARHGLMSSELGAGLRRLPGKAEIDAILGQSGSSADGAF
jgi:hypothetical protein